jgi:hypothetical protein
MFNKNKATLALLVDLHNELIRKIDEQIKVEKDFIGKLESFFMFEQKLDNERWKAEQLDSAAKKVYENDRRF